jgi:proton-dependent oligopeptide transporter, POT family
MTAIAGEIDVLPQPRTVFGHPRGILTIAGTELWDRVSFHGMQALLVLYMVDQLLLPGDVERIAGFGAVRAAIESVTGPLSVQALATQIFGLYVGFVYVTPVFGGLLGDRVLGRRRAVALGALLMTAGHFCMAFDASFLLALLLLILGAGTLRGNLAPQLGELYDAADRRRNTAFQIYGSAVNLGAFIAPLITGQLAQSYGWHVGFAFAGVGMLVGLIFYLLGKRDLPPEPLRGALRIAAPLSLPERRTVLLLVLFVPLGALYWIAQSQVWNTYNLWVRDHVALKFGHWTMPVPWLQSLDGLAPFMCLPLVLWLWRWQATRGREPDEISKMAIGCLLFGASTLFLAGASLAAGAHGRASLLWSVAFHFGSNLGWLYFAPTAYAFFTRLAPQSINSTMLGVYFLAIFIGSTISGRLGGLYEVVSPAAFWALHAGLVALGGVLIFAYGAMVRKSMSWPAKAGHPGDAALVLENE